MHPGDMHPGDRDAPDPAWVVMKFGGTSVATPAGWRTIAESCARVEAEGKRALVVCSALAGVSDLLEALIERALVDGDSDAALAEIQRRHHLLAAQLGVPLPDEVSELLDELSRAEQGIRLLREASPRVRARIMASGELMSTRLGCAWLAAQGTEARWLDARSLLRSTLDSPASSTATEGQRFLSAEVHPAPSAEARAALPECPVVLTQGFIAADDQGETVVLGRGGSDTSAAYLAVLIAAERVEIWTDVPGLFTANPQQVADARHLDRLGYDEVAAMASLGARVLHPRCIGPACEAGLPIHVRSTYLPGQPGTVVQGMETRAGIKAVTARKGLALLRMCRPSQWQPVGFVADVSACFKRHGLSIDLMSTSPSTLTATVDPTSAPDTSLDALVADLEAVCEVSLEGPVASVSLVGTRVREAFDHVGGAMPQLSGVPIHLVAQGAANHHLSFVVDEERADALVATLHEALFQDEGAVILASPTWRDLGAAAEGPRVVPA